MLRMPWCLCNAVQAGKWRITHRLGIQTRDLRLLDPHQSVPFPCALLCRDKAIVVRPACQGATFSFVLM
jgi:hypothetical protein